MSDKAPGTPCSQQQMVSLREYLERLIGDLGLAMDRRFQAEEKAVTTALLAVRESNISHFDAHNREHEMAREARARADNVIDTRFDERFRVLQVAQDKFEANVTSRFDKTNEWRAMVEDQQETLARVDYVNSEIRRIESIIMRIDDEESKRIEINVERIAQLERHNVGTQSNIAELTTISRDVRDLRDYRATAQGRGAVLSIISAAIVAVLVSVVTALILFSLTR